MVGGVYKIINLVTKDFYIGGSKNLSNRKSKHFSNFRKNKGTRLLQKAFNEFGAENFEFKVLLYCEPFELTRYEQTLVNLWNPTYNICKEDVHTTKGVIATEETRKKLSLALMGNKHLLGKYPSNETRAKMSLARKGKPRSDETKRKISESHKRRKLVSSDG
jgi:group I intron endonuclease